MIASTETLICSWIIHLFGAAVLILRVWYAYRQQKRLQPAEYVCIFCAIIILVGASLFTVVVLTLHDLESELSRGEFLEAILGVPKLLKISTTAVVCYYTLVFGVKGILCATFYGMRENFNHRALQIGVDAVALYLLSSYIVVILSLFLSCQPLSRVWLSPLDPDWCNAQPTPIMALGLALNLTSDAAIFVFAVCLVRTMTFRRNEVVVITCLFLMAAISMSCAGIRYYMLRMTRDMTGLEFDRIRIAGLISAAEWFLGLLVGCVPAFRSVLRNVSMKRERRKRDFEEPSLRGEMVETAV